MRRNKIIKSYFFQAVIYNILMLLLFTCIFHPYYETNDDKFMALVSDGAVAGYSSHLIFINVIYGKILYILHQILPQINWYSILLFFLLWLAFTCMTYVWLKIKGKKAGSFISLIFLLWFGYYSYVVMQFTRVSGILTVSGILLVFYAIEREEKRKRILLVVLGSFLALLGSLLRFNMFLLDAAVMVGLGLYKVIQLYRTGGFKKVREIWKYLLVFSTILVCAFGCRALDTYVYNQDAGWAYYREYNDLRAELLDYGFPGYEENKEVYDSLGLTQEDIDYYATWNFADPEKFSIETLKTLVSLKKPREINLEFFINFVWEMAQRIFYEKSFLLFALIFLISCFDFKKNLFSLGWAAAMAAGTQMYLYYQGRYLVERVDTPLWFGLSCFLVYTGTLSLSQKTIRNLKLWAAAAMVFILNGDVFLSNMVQEPDPAIQQEAKEMFDRISEDTENLYCATTGSLEEAYDLQHRMEEFRMHNFYYLGGWLYNSPVTEQAKKNYNVENPFRECINNEHINIVGIYSLEETENYIRRHYDANVKFQKIKAVHGQNVYAAVSGELQPEQKAESPLNSDIVYDLAMNRISEDRVAVQGYIFKKNTNSFNQKMYVRTVDRRTGKTSFVYGTQMENPSYTKNENGKYSGIYQEIQLPSTAVDYLEVSVILEIEGKWYTVVLENR